MEVPSYFFAFSWLPFVGVFLIITLFSICYIRRFKNKHESEASSTVVAILGLIVTLVTSLLLPVDVFTVSYMKNLNGTYKEWASNETFRTEIEDTILYTYYAFYLLVLIFCFIVLPFMYFFFEEKDDLNDILSQRMFSALKYTIGFMFLASILLIIGALLPWRTIPPEGSSEWEKLKYILNFIQQDKGKGALFFTFGSLSVIGLLTLVTYTAFGLAVWPLSLIRGKMSAAREHQFIRNRISENEVLRNNLMNRYGSRIRRIPQREQNLLAELEESEHHLSHQEREINEVRRFWCYTCRVIIRPLQIIAGVLLTLFSVLIWVSLLITNIDKLMHSLGFTLGYINPKNTFLNPLDVLLVYFQKYFPLDYVFFSITVFYLLLCTMGGMERTGLWFFCVKLYKIRRGKTRPQALLMMCLILMYSLLALNILIYNLTPQYMMFGDQRFLGNATFNDTHIPVLTCIVESPAQECQMTRAAFLITEFFYKDWYFGLIHFWGSWIFLLVSICSFVYALIYPPQSNVESRSDMDIFDESDDEPLLR